MDVTSEARAVARKPLSQNLGWVLPCLAVTVLASWVRLSLFRDRFMPLAYGLPLLLCLWNGSLPLLYGMAVAFTATAVLKTLHLFGGDLHGGPLEWVSLGMELADIWILAGVLHAWLAARKRLEHQSSKLRTQASELEQQGGQLRQINREMARRERGLQTLLESARWLCSDLDERAVMDAICQAAVQVMSEEVQAAAIAQNSTGLLRFQGHCGFGITGAVKGDLVFRRSFAAQVLERGQTLYVEDAQLRQDIELAQPAAGPPFRSVLATPVWLDGQPVAAVEVFSIHPRQWTVEQFRVAEWLAAQCALALKAMRFQHELQLKRRDAEEASIQKTQFLAAVSHDVRTPANAISLLADLIEHTAGAAPQSQEIGEMARDLRSNARALIELVSDVLDLARFDAGKLDMQISEFTLDALVQAEIRQALPVAQSKGLRLYAALPPREIWVRSDRMKLARVLSNLIGNALKFTESGQVEVRCEPCTDGSVNLSVNDTGVGIPAEHLPRIFDEFFQLRNPERDRSKGTGLGLAICRRLVEGLGCRISVKSVLGQGTTFSVHICAGIVAAHCPSESSETTTRPREVRGQAPLDGLRVLLVEDHDVTRQTVAHLLAARGAVVSQARAGREALHLLAHGPHDVMLLDLMLPDIDGSEVLRSLQCNRPPWLRCILAVSGDVREARIEEVKRLGADDLVPKPLSIDGLMAALRTHCLSRLERRPGAAGSRAAADSISMQGG